MYKITKKYKHWYNDWNGYRKCLQFEEKEDLTNNDILVNELTDIISKLEVKMKKIILLKALV